MMWLNMRYIASVSMSLYDCDIFVKGGSPQQLNWMILASNGVLTPPNQFVVIFHHLSNSWEWTIFPLCYTRYTSILWSSSDILWLSCDNCDPERKCVIYIEGDHAQSDLYLVKFTCLWFSGWYRPQWAQIIGLVILVTFHPWITAILVIK